MWACDPWSRMRRAELALGSGDRRRALLRHRLPQSAVLGLLHQLRRGFDERHHGLARTEAMLFKFGSGTGTNFSSLRSSHEAVSGGGTASGPLSSCAGWMLLPGSSSPAANAPRRQDGHSERGSPGYYDFIECKAREEAKAHSLIKAGYDGSGPVPRPFVDLLPERQQLRARQRRVHARLRERRRLHHLHGQKATSLLRVSRRARSCARSPRPPGSAATPECSSTLPSIAGTPARTPPHFLRRIPARSICSRQLGLQSGQLQPDEVCYPARQLRHSRLPALRSRLVIPRWRFWWTTPGIPPKRIARNSHDYRPLGWVTPTGRAADRLSACLMTRLPAAIWPPPSPLSSAASLPAVLHRGRNCPSITRPRRWTANVDRPGGACPGSMSTASPSST